MVGTLIKQPNGKYCIVGYDDEITKYNLNEQDIINMYIEDAKAHIGAAEPYGNLIAKMVHFDRIRNIPDDTLKKMGFNKTYKELLKFVPLRPYNSKYAHCDFTTYGKCPSCGNVVMNGMMRTDESCECGQLLKW